MKRWVSQNFIEWIEKMIKVVNLHNSRYTVYIGRPSPWGNPWTSKTSTKAEFFTKTSKEAVENYEKWLKGEKFMDIFQEKRQWILNHLTELDNQVLGCFCKPNICHGDVLKKLVDEKYKSMK